MKRFIASGAIIVYALSVIVFCTVLPAGEKATATDFGVMCINAVYPSASIELADSRDNENLAETGGENSDGQSGGDDKDVVVSEEESSDPVVLGDDPLVLIVHTHATESYLPASGSNFHSKGEENTVRDVGLSLIHI